MYKVLKTGSDGNCIYIEDSGVAILVDIGIGPKKLKQDLSVMEFQKIQGILLTHEHHDHVLGIETTGKAITKPVYGTNDTLSVLNIEAYRLEPVYYFRPFRIKHLRITPFPVYHDALQPCGYFIEGTENYLVVMDSGRIDSWIIEFALRSDYVLIEFNHCSELVYHTPRPRSVQERGSLTHLNNSQVANLLSYLHSSVVVEPLHVSYQANAKYRVEQALSNQGLLRFQGASPRSSTSEQNASTSHLSDLTIDY